jgi:hypothetical protein
MQTFTALLDETIERSALEKSWLIGNELSPKAEFDIDGTTVRITITSDIPFDEASFKRAFGSAVHRIAPSCEVQWI